MEDLKHLRTALHLAVLVLFIPLLLLDGYAISMLWKWYAVPLGASPISTIHAAGLMILVRFVTHQVPPYREQTSMEKMTQSAVWLLMGVTYPLVALAIGSILRGFM